ncbi:MAG TPA: hypothetical protein VK034_17520 [Enhygromyxa sp.]|nr:hypothetical protein [Enhygromyxa sp.]
MQVLIWAEFDDFWRELEASHEQTPYTFDAYDEEVARIAFKAGRESMRRQVVAMVEHLLETNLADRRRLGRDAEAARAALAEVGRSVLRELADDVSELVRAEEN